MKAFIQKLLLYTLLIFVALELLVRAFHLYTEDPPRFIDEFGVEKRVPNNTGYAVYGNRNQKFSRFRINQQGFNSHREFVPGTDKFEVAITGDSFIEGFHQDVNNSIGNKIEDLLPGIEVYEYGYAGYDLANQMHLINAYGEDFEKIDEIIVYLNYESDLNRASYTPNYDRIKMLRSPLFRLRDNIKLLAYGSKIGVLEPLKKLATGKAFEEGRKGYQTNEIEVMSAEEIRIRDEQYLNNFKSLARLYGFDKSKTTFLLDSRKTSAYFLSYCQENGIRYIDFAPTFQSSNRATTLIYDWHWNNHGRDLIAKVVSNYVEEKHGKQVALTN